MLSLEKGKRFFTPFSIGCYFWAGQWKKILQNEGTMNLKTYFCTSIIGEGGYRLFRSFAGPDSMKDYKLVFTIVKNPACPGCILVIGYRWACGASFFVFTSSWEQESFLFNFSKCVTELNPLMSFKWSTSFLKLKASLIGL